MPMDNKTRNAWIDMISKVYVNLHNNQRVLNSSNKSDKKRERIIKYFNRLEEVHNKVSSQSRIIILLYIFGFL